MSDLTEQQEAYERRRGAAWQIISRFDTNTGALGADNLRMNVRIGFRPAEPHEIPGRFRDLNRVVNPGMRPSERQMLKRKLWRQVALDAWTSRWQAKCARVAAEVSAKRKPTLRPMELRQWGPPPVDDMIRWNWTERE